MSFPPPSWLRRSLMSLPVLTFASAAFASQGPGAGPGTAGLLAQLVMAIIVYGGAALLLITGLIGSLKRRV
jgi:hypothetical protein